MVHTNPATAEMKFERWGQISRLYQEALERDSLGRAAFLNEVCAGDAALREEIESLIAHEHTAEGFMATPAIEVAAEMMSARPESVASRPATRHFSHFVAARRGGNG